MSQLFDLFCKERYLNVFHCPFSWLRDAQGVFNSKISISLKFEAAYRRLLANSPFPLPLLLSLGLHLFLQMSMGPASHDISHVLGPHRVFSSAPIFFYVLTVLPTFALSNIC